MSPSEIMALAAQMDQDDPLASFREQFHIPPQTVYLCGNSLGLQPKSVAGALQQELEDWQRLGVEGHLHARDPWMPYHETVTAPLARLAGALPAEVVAMNGLTVNLHLMMVSFYRPTPQRHRIIIEANSFPSDRYAVESQLRFHGYNPEEALIVLQPRETETTLRTADVESALAEHGAAAALLLMGGVNYYTGQCFEMERITQAARAQGCTVGWDLAHAIGNVPLRLHDWGADFACWCSYKYLNAGPGSIAGCFVHERHHHGQDLPRFAGWWGHAKDVRFEMGPKFHAIPTAEGWQLSNPPILSLAALRASLAIFDGAGMEALREKSLRLTGLLESLLLPLCTQGVEVFTPQDPTQRGCQLSLRLANDGRSAFKKLMEQKFVCDWREPDCVRVAPVPLYNTFTDVARFAIALAAIVGGAA